MSVSAYTVSDDGNLPAYSTDSTGFRQYTLHLKDLRTGKTLEDHAERVGSVVWANDTGRATRWNGFTRRQRTG
jgi:oligopeptidase B